MLEATVAPLVTWGSFYTIIGSAAATLTGLMFVTITVIMGRARREVRRSNATIAAFGTPTVVHFCTTILVATVLSAPWQTLWHTGLLLSLAGLSGIIYMIIVIKRTHHQMDYKPVLEDWLWHTIFPFVSYLGLTIAAFVLPIDPELALFGIGAITVLFLFIGIHNAWDTVTYIVLQPEDKDQNQE